MKVHPYLNYEGQAEEAFNFYKSIIGGEFTAKIKMEEAPAGYKFPAAEQNHIMHIALPIGKDAILMASDIVPSMGHILNKGNNTYVSLHPESKDEADRLFNGLSQGGDIEMEIQDTFWGDYHGSFTDKFGIRWMINFGKQQSS